MGSAYPRPGALKPWWRTMVKPATHAVAPSGVMAMNDAHEPTLIGWPAVLVAVAIGSTVPEPKFAT